SGLRASPGSAQLWTLQGIALAGEGNALQRPQLSAAWGGSQPGAGQLDGLVEFSGPQRRGNGLRRVLSGLGKGQGMASQHGRQETKRREWSHRAYRADVETLGAQD